MKIRTLQEFMELDTASRIKNLKSLVVRQETGKKEIAKLLVAAERRNDFGPGEMNSWCKDRVGVELRRQAQGTYEAAAVMREIASGNLAMTEQEFDKAPSYGLIVLSSLMKKSPEKVGDALAIIRAGKDVTAGLKALIKGPGKSKDAAPAVSEIQTPSGGETQGEETPQESAATATGAKTYVLRDDEIVMNHQELVARIVDEISNAETIEDVNAYVGIFDALKARAVARLAELEAAATPAAAAA